MTLTKQQYYEKAYDKARVKGYSVAESNEIALKSTKEYTPKKEVKGKKSFVMQQNISTGNIIDVPFGYSAPDAEEIYGGNRLDYSGWDNVPSESLLGDINHFSFDSSEGIANDLDQKWHHFITEAKEFYTVNKNGITELRGKVEVPDTDLGKEFLERYNRGEFGVSIEYEGYEDGDIIKDWKITGYTFDENPSYNTKKQP